MELSRFPRSTPEAQGVRRTRTCRFSDDSMRVTQQANLSFGSLQRPTLEGRIAGGR